MWGRFVQISHLSQKFSRSVAKKMKQQLFFYKGNFSNVKESNGHMDFKAD